MLLEMEPLCSIRVNGPGIYGRWWVWNRLPLGWSHKRGFGCGLKLRPRACNQYSQNLNSNSTAISWPKSDNQTVRGLGIKQFLKDKKILVTGATGFLAKVLVEKILRAQPEVGQIYLLINAESTTMARHRVANEILTSRLFGVLQEKHGLHFQEFMESKITAVAGNISKSDLGLEKEVASVLHHDLDLIVNSAATTSFVERYDVAINVNTRGPLHLLEFAKQCPRLKLYLHISTAYVNGTRKGKTVEKPFEMGQSIAEEIHGKHKIPPLDVLQEISLIQNYNGMQYEDGYMKELGLKRAKIYGWQDTYVFTKAMGEMLICQRRGHVPIVIVRPSVVEGTIKEPFPGWMEGVRMMDPIVLSYGKGQLKSFYVDPKGVLDLVPADMVANSIIATMARHFGMGPGFKIYHVGSSVVNPLKFADLAKLSYEHFISQPFMDQGGHPIIVPKLKLITNNYSLLLYNYFHFYLPLKMGNLLPWMKTEENKRRLKYISYVAQRVKQLIETYSPYTFYEGRFDISNTQSLYKEMSTEEAKDFGFDLWSIDWNNYIKYTHLPGLRKYTLNDSNFVMRL